MKEILFEGTKWYCISCKEDTRREMVREKAPKGLKNAWGELCQEVGWEVCEVCRDRKEPLWTKSKNSRPRAQSTHWEGCYDNGPKHYDCAMDEIERLGKLAARRLKLVRDLMSIMPVFPRYGNQVVGIRERYEAVLAAAQEELDKP